MMAAAITLLAAAAPEHPMNEPFIAALDRALKGDANILQGLGIEEAMITSPLWDDRVAVDGKGEVTVTSRRASGDPGGVPIGIFRDKMEQKELVDVIRSLRQLAAAPPPPSRSEAYETRILLSAVADGHLFGLGVPAFPPAMELLQPVLMPLNRAMGRAMQHPVRSLTLGVAIPAGVPRDGALTVVLHLINGGTEGFWVSNPARVSNQPEHERVTLVYARPLVITPGVAPMPVRPNKTPLTGPESGEPQPKYLWVPPKGDVPVPLQAKIQTGDAKELVFRVEFHADEGESTVAGQPRLKGSVFSADLTAPVK
jgi:hypothetical protein